MENQYGIFFARGSTVIRLPLNPEELPVDRGNENDSYNVLDIGPIMVPRKPSLRVITLSGLFPGRVFPGVLTPNEFQLPEFYIRFFNTVMDAREPIQFIPARYLEDGTPFMGGNQNVGLTVLVTSFTYKEKAGETGDFYYDIELTEYRDYTPQTVQVQTQGNGQPAVATSQQSRSIPQGQLYVGAACTANGPYYASSYGDEPHGNGNGRRVLVSRIVDGSRAYPVYVTTESGGALGWMKKDALQVVSDT